MTIVYDAASQSAGNAHPLQFNHTVTSLGANRILFVATDTIQAVTGVTYGGDSMTKVNELGTYVSLWYLVAPSTGVNQISISRSSTSKIAAGGVSFTGVHQTSPYDTPVTEIAGDASINVEGELLEVLLDVLGQERAGAEPSANPSSGQTEVVDINHTISSPYHGIRMAYVGAGEGTNTLSWTTSGTNEVQYGLALQPAGGGRIRLTRYLHNTYMSLNRGK
jgi:hypothetical protein